jgi:hypothetical protein
MVGYFLKNKIMGRKNKKMVGTMIPLDRKGLNCRFMFDSAMTHA